MAWCGSPQLREPRQGAARRAPQLRAEPRRPTVSKRGHQPPRGPAVGRVVISGNGAGSAGVRGPALASGEEERAAPRGARRAGRCATSVSGRGGAGAGRRRAAPRPRAHLSLSPAEEWRREGPGLGVLPNPGPQ